MVYHTVIAAAVAVVAVVTDHAPFFFFFLFHDPSLLFPFPNPHTAVLYFMTVRSEFFRVISAANMPQSKRTSPSSVSTCYT